MLNNILGGKKNNQKKEVSDEELKKLRDQFKEIASSNTTATASPQQTPAQAQDNTVQNNSQPATAKQEVTYVDPEKVEENERITNLIMQQIKELIEIDNNLNIKIKEIETKLRGNMSNISDIKNVVDKFHQRLEFIEKNMEKFMGLYEVVTNRFNPFIENEEGSQETTQKPAESNINIPDVPVEEEEGKEQQEKQPEQAPEPTPKVEADIPDIPKEEPKPIEEPVPTPKPVKAPESQPAQPQVNQGKVMSAQEIIDNSGIKGKLDDEQISLVLENIDSIVAKLGDKYDSTESKKITENLTKKTNELVVESIKKHNKIDNNAILRMVKDIADDSEVKIELKEVSETPETTTLEPSTKEEPKFETLADVPKEEPKPTTEEPVPTPEPVKAPEPVSPATPTVQETPTQVQESPATASDEDLTDPQFHFVLPNGEEIKSVADLKEALKTMDDASFAEHVNDEKNDFATWIGLVKGDWMLAEKISNMKTKQAILEEVEKI